MRIGHHRPLFCLCAVWMLAAGLGCVLSGFDGHQMLPAGAVCTGLAAGVLSVCLLLRLLRRITARRACAVGLALLCAGLSLLNSGAYFSGQVTPDSSPDFRRTPASRRLTVPGRMPPTCRMRRMLRCGRCAPWSPNGWAEAVRLPATV